MDDNLMLEMKDITKVYGRGDSKVEALKGINLNVKEGEFIAIMGASGSGKSTLMHIIGCLDKPTSGEYILSGDRVDTLTQNELSLIRLKKIGFIFQGFFLIARTSALENVETPLLYAGIPSQRRNEIALNLLKEVGLGDRISHLPSELSGGQQQKVAVARSLVNNPSIILADEPTGNLDTKTSREIMELFVNLNKEKNLTIILVTHEEDIANYAARRIILRDGAIVSC